MKEQIRSHELVDSPVGRESEHRFDERVTGSELAQGGHRHRTSGIGLCQGRVESPTDRYETRVVRSHSDGGNPPEVFTPLALQQGLVVPDTAEGEVTEEAAGQRDPQSEEKDGASTDVPESRHSVSHGPLGKGGHTTTHAALVFPSTYVLCREPA